jgi:uncharacterized protein YcbK (DUF882 family)
MSITRPDAHGRPASRRSALRLLLCTAAAAAFTPALARAAGRGARSLSFVHTHTLERLSATYFASGSYDLDSLAALSRFLRDHRTGDIHPIDPPLFDMLFDLRAAVGGEGPFQVISGFRSPRTNAELRARSRGVAAGSLHVAGKAIDVRLAGIDCTALRDAAIRLQRGGVGCYASSDFVHLDTGRFRTW